MDRPYDDAKGIAGYLEDLDGLNRLKKDRQEAGYRRKERLQEWLVLGRWMMDTCGNFGDCTLQDDRYKPMPDSVAAGMPPVVPRDDIFKLYHVHSTSTSGSISCVPPVRVHCRECGQKWTVSNAHDAVVETDTCKIDLAPYVGKTFRDLDNDLRAKVDGSYFLSHELPLKHERFVDMTPHPTIKDYFVNKDGWVNLGEFVNLESEKGRDRAAFDRYLERFERTKVTFEMMSDPWNYAFQAGDRTYGHVHYYTHKHCFTLKKSRDSRDYYVKIFLDAGMPEPVTREVPNERCQEQCCMPWVVGQFPFGDIKIGWRSSVINIDWSGLPGKPDYVSLFEGEETTKGPTHVHAHSRAKAVEYLQQLKAAVDAGLKCDRSQCPGPPTSFYLLNDSELECFCRSHDVTMAGSRKRLTFLEAVIQKIHST